MWTASTPGMLAIDTQKRWLQLAASGFVDSMGSPEGSATL
jgi:hypothetical protein